MARCDILFCIARNDSHYLLSPLPASDHSYTIMKFVGLFLLIVPVLVTSSREKAIHEQVKQKSESVGVRGRKLDADEKRKLYISRYNGNGYTNEGGSTVVSSYNGRVGNNGNVVTSNNGRFGNIVRGNNVQYGNGYTNGRGYNDYDPWYDEHGEYDPWYDENDDYDPWYDEHGGYYDTKGSGDYDPWGEYGDDHYEDEDPWYEHEGDDWYHDDSTPGEYDPWYNDEYNPDPWDGYRGGKDTKGSMTKGEIRHPNGPGGPGKPGRPGGPNPPGYPTKSRGSKGSGGKTSKGMMRMKRPPHAKTKPGPGGGGMCPLDVST